ncbi:MAG: hypothetical protein U1D55_15230 [Phycisphaerae bacterium]
MTPDEASQAPLRWVWSPLRRAAITGLFVAMSATPGFFLAHQYFDLSGMLLVVLFFWGAYFWFCSTDWFERWPSDPGAARALQIVLVTRVTLTFIPVCWLPEILIGSFSLAISQVSFMDDSWPRSDVDFLVSERGGGENVPFE